MKYLFKICLAGILLVTTTYTLATIFLFKSANSKHRTAGVRRINPKTGNPETLARLKQKAASVKSFVSANHFNSNLCFLIDMRMSSGQKRFYVYNLLKDSVEASGLVTHGSGSDKGGTELYFSNVPNSNCTSLGRYRVGKSYWGRFGLAYKLYGLDGSNNKAFYRNVVLHAHSCVPSDETDPLPICESWGCPTVAPSFLNLLKGYIDNSEHPVLLWIYY